MTRWERWAMYVANLLVGGTGVLYAMMRYFMKPADEWSVVNHPWQPHVQHLHVLAAPLLVFVCGLIWQRHVSANLRRKEEGRRHSGPGLLVALVPMVASGYLIQTTVTEVWRQTWIVVHLVASATWTLAFVGHLLSPYKQRLRDAVPALRAFKTRM